MDENTVNNLIEIAYWVTRICLIAAIVFAGTQYMEVHKDLEENGCKRVIQNIEKQLNDPTISGIQEDPINQSFYNYSLGNRQKKEK